jgi:hypothetical protein
VVIAVFNVYGMWKSPKALDPMNEWYTKWPDEKGFRTIAVSVDTGTAGGGDQAAATARGSGLAAAERGWKPRPPCAKALRAAFTAITGKGIRRAEDLAEYIRDPKKYRDPELVRKRLSEDTRTAIYKEWMDAKETAKKFALEKMPDDDKGDERAKVYWRRALEMRKEMLEKRGIKLSELDVIVEDAEG